MAPTRSKQKRGLSFPVRHAEQPAQTLNVDLCFIPVQHDVAEHLPAVSGSSGQLRVASAPHTAARSAPGQLFAQHQLDYAEAMAAFVAASPPRLSVSTQPAAEQQAHHDLDARAARHQADRLRIQKREQRVQRRAEDQLWRKLWHQQYQPAAAEARLERELWLSLRRQRRLLLLRRAEQDAEWRAARAALRQQLEPSRSKRRWLAVLLVSDNCTRQCLGLPLLESGASVTAAEVAAALRPLLPDELQFVVSDRGTHFTAASFAELLEEAEVLQVLTARHRPQSNGIAERCIQTLKRWLEQHSWTNAAELRELLAGFKVEYNQRPHQGLAIPGLSPNEFARRIWLM